MTGRVTHVDGMENPGENFRRTVAGWLVGHGCTDTDTDTDGDIDFEAVLGGNILRLLKEVWR
ncbi:hypothetical protein QF026_000164 [Streptomyces aurantiacus]|uniref:hypothetical protein n=1 Tax=Streptomyces aurantiacus TaxID=47760 RepID=UPI0027906128|nr:hypothetical protein [Streptomyces aurantiacus]MDQ0771698.1 hypothetical protein [Streptomyces aurantiacus]